MIDVPATADAVRFRTNFGRAMPVVLATRCNVDWSAGMMEASVRASAMASLAGPGPVGPDPLATLNLASPEYATVSELRAKTPPLVPARTHKANTHQRRLS